MRLELRQLGLKAPEKQSKTPKILMLMRGEQQILMFEKINQYLGGFFLINDMKEIN